MKLAAACAAVMISAGASAAQAEEKLLLDVDLSYLSLSHNVSQFYFQPTKNTYDGTEDNINNMAYPVLDDHLLVTTLLRRDGEVVGVATQTEILEIDEEAPKSRTLWTIRLSAPDLKGFLVVEQDEDASGVAKLKNEVRDNPHAFFPNEWRMVPTSAEGTRVSYASGDLKRYEGGKFLELFGVNQADPKNYGVYRGRAQLEIHPAE